MLNLRASILLQSALDGDPRIAQTHAMFEQLIQSFSHEIDLDRIRLIRSNYAFLSIRLQKYDLAESILVEKIGDELMNPILLADIFISLGTIQIRRGNAPGAKSYFHQGWALMRNFAPETHIRRRMVELADWYELIDDKDMVIEILRATNKPVGNFSAILQNSN